MKSVVEGIGNDMEQDSKQLQEKPEERGRRNVYSRAARVWDSEKKKKMNERLKKLGYDLPF